MNLNTNVRYEDSSVYVGIHKVMQLYIRGPKYDNGYRRPKKTGVVMWSTFPGYSQCSGSIDDVLETLTNMGLDDLEPFLKACRARGWDI